jgi:hypothetical protein
MNDKRDRLDSLGERDDYYTRLAKEVEAFLLGLEANPDDLVAFVNNRLAFLNESSLSNDAKTLLLESNYSLVQEVMKYRESPAIRWICIWVI